MSLHVNALCIAARDPALLAGFWSGVLGWAPEAADGDAAYPTLLPPDDTGFRLRFLPTDRPKRHPSWMHFDLTSATLRDQEATVARALALGGRHHDVGQLPEEEHVVLADPEGNEFCVIEPGNDFLADCGFIGALSSEGTREVGYFWSAALGWPLCWDQDEETAVRSPAGGPKLTFGGPPIAPKHGRNRWHFDLAPGPGDDRDAEVERLVGLGATRLPDRDGVVELTDPDGNEFCVLGR
jgi:predicted enzyme related to lactoylglutathione lyase